ncbi:pyruvate kinase [Arachidicoccus ginsenosidimutans]|uniref:pyruvate kinase n=1 Tax=Arachidicoccus sp. BS20 TaxID=1850526 RepID=UPI0007F0D661|nr:pyruvate kinase [Arachidicoccus sp. BS20]ANI90674.1 pyruvate kinase [Arachidicoccus sp. BS20]
MSESVEKYLHKEMDADTGIQHNFHRTKIVATVGPACEKYEQLLDLAKVGVNVFRLNFSHGTHENKAEIIDNIRRINKEEPFNIAILGDLQGPKLRVGKLENDKLHIEPGDILTFTSTEKVIGTKEKIYVSYPNLHNDVAVGEKILIDDGKLEVVVTEVDKTSGNVKVRVTYGGDLLPNKGVNLPDTNISLPAMTEKDLIDLEFILEQDLDWVALSFVRKAEDMINLRKLVDEKGSKIKIMSKIEMPSAMEDLKNIVNESDGVMVARGDLGVELPVEKIPLAQKEIIRKCLHRSKPVIVATQMMESMIDRIKPNRSEITDVANAVLEGADAVMLSGETATGKHPTLVVETMRKIIMEVEKTDYRYDRGSELKVLAHSPTVLSDALCYNACKIAQEVNAAALIGMTQSGYTAFRISSYRPKVPLYIFTKEKQLVNQLSLSWGVRAFFYEEEISLDNIINDEINILHERQFIKDGDVVVNTASTPVQDHLPTNILKITRVGK